MSVFVYVCVCVPAGRQLAVVAGGLTADEWVHASEFVPGQMWTGYGFGK